MVLSGVLWLLLACRDSGYMEIAFFFFQMQLPTSVSEDEGDGYPSSLC